MVWRSCFWHIFLFDPHKQGSGSELTHNLNILISTWNSVSKLKFQDVNQYLPPAISLLRPSSPAETSPKPNGVQQQPWSLEGHFRVWGSNGREEHSQNDCMRANLDSLKLLFPMHTSQMKSWRTSAEINVISRVSGKISWGGWGSKEQ